MKIDVKMNFHVQLLESHFLGTYQGLHLTNSNPNATVTPNSISRNDIPPLEVTHTASHVTGTIAVTSPPPLQMNGNLPGTPVPKGKCHVCLVQLKDLVKKEYTVVDRNQTKGNDRKGLALKRKNETQE